MAPGKTYCTCRSNLSKEPKMRGWKMLLALTVAMVLLELPEAVAAERAADQGRIGHKVAGFTLQDYRGRAWSLDDFKESQAVVVAFVGVECPIVQHYAARLQQLADRYAEQGVTVIAIDANQQDSLTELAHFARQHKLEIPVLKDPGNKVADVFGAQRTPEAFLLDRERRIVYHGRIDDQFTYGIQRPKVEKSYLVDAIEELLAAKPVAVPYAEAVGCHIGRVLEPKADSEVTYSRQIARIFQDRCVSCHRPGEIGPFSLTSYDDVVGWAEMIREVVQEQRMPPWHANPEHGQFINDARLSDEEKKLIYHWVEAGAPEGDKADLPPPRTFVEGWQIDEPDLVVYMDEKPFQVPATGTVRYQYFVADPGFEKDTWVKAAECRPGNRAVVHHIIVAILQPGATRPQQAFGDITSDWLVATAPGARPLLLKEGMARLIPAGSKLVFQMHYTPNGTPQEDRSCVGLVFADPKEVRKHVGTDKAIDTRFRIPPRTDNHKVEATRRFDKDTLVLSLFPHMHLRGKAFRYTARYPDGREEILLDVPQYDFNWQNTYEFVEPKRMPAGTTLFCEAWFDNSAKNLANPDPTQEVRWGEQTWEEMMIGYFSAMPADQDLRLDAAAARPQRERTEQFVALARDGKATLGDDLKKLAAAALESDEALNRFGPALRKVAPQLDRLCWTTIEEDKLHVRRCVQDANFDRIVGRGGRKVDLRLTRIATYADSKEPVVHADLAAVRAIDLQLMSRAYGSSLHIPVTIGGLKGTLNFWSTDKDAFPPEVVKLLVETAKVMAQGQ